MFGRLFCMKYIFYLVNMDCCKRNMIAKNGIFDFKYRNREMGNIA